jgi:16S rRNA (cytidine1402-2'-O)-methyltransferase
VENKTGRLTLVATPIGNLGDLSRRAIETLSEADWWIVEDTRVSAKLQSVLGIKKRMVVLNDHSRPEKIEAYVEGIEDGSHVALVTDGGSPVISDPGALLVDRVRDAGVDVDAIPGPSAVTNALALSGFFAQRFVFLGFLGRKAGSIRSELEPFTDSPLTIVLFESPFRIRKMLETAHETLGSRRYAICREMTKTFQQVYRARLPEAPDVKTMPEKGEITLVIEGKRKQKNSED